MGEDSKELAVAEEKEVSVVEEKEIEVVEEKEVAVVEEIDNALVEEACIYIAKIFSTHFEKAVLEAGQYLIKEFFEDDFEKANKKNKIKNSSKGTSLNKVFENFKRKASEDADDGSQNAPSKSWLYQAINFAVQEHEFKELNHDEKSFQTYGKLLLSHKIELLRIKTIEKKIKLLQTKDIEKTSVRAFRDKVSKYTDDPKKMLNGVLSLINKPNLLLLEKSKNTVELETLKKEGLTKLEKFQDRLGEKKEEIEKELDEMEDKKNEYNKYIEKFDKLKIIIEEAIKYKKIHGKEKKTAKKS